MKIGIIGAGNMGSALYHRMAPFFGVEQVWVHDVDNEKLRSYPPAHASTDLKKIVNQVDAVILAVKPQSFEEWDCPLKTHLVISIMTGITVGTIEKRTGAKKIVRSMPNLALKLGHSLTAWIATKALSLSEKTFVHTLFSLFGKEMEVAREEQLNEVTAISGSGPAYFFFLCSELMKKAEEFGFSAEQARTMVTETLMGSAALLHQAGGNSEQLIHSIKSKGGTTEAALNTFHAHHTSSIISKAVEAAKKRAEELST